MMLKKQTVWLLTMLSLVVVLSVYYVTSPEGGSSNVVMTGDDQKVSENAKTEDGQEVAKEEGTEAENAEATETTEESEATEESQATDTDETSEKTEGTEAGEEGEVQTEELEDGTVISSSSVSSDELFTELRLQLDDQRNELKEQLQTIVASNDASATEKSDAYDEMEALNDAARKEMLLETLIKSKGFDDALVRADGNNVKITVKAKEHNASSANQIMTLVRDEMENMEDVIVTFEPAQ
ncbi:SpoIIIAH-like family protein [Metabacillus halosaccharovorans]|uniref:SpoIIIAH-like family protein n=1 Tax=Metabacillus halosaccharovorans TaxID=930124 RepID=A0ABT3DMQ4_9BACI|nr:SpoIIIAH-like family protein [Metabacillus halosaccharovorans]MBU7593460.1 SpoIIIAH-like family protein [Metabacillus halosaccharovorans]MCV9888189.1 SpoIIIAH-like family protein [Metabacillus halosaccharovorans]